MSRHGTGRWRRLGTRVTVAALVAREAPRPDFGADPQWGVDLAAMRVDLVEQDATDRLMGLPEAMLTETVAPVAPPSWASSPTTGVLAGWVDGGWLATVRGVLA